MENVHFKKEECIVDKVILLDGGMGTMLQAASLKPGEMPEYQRAV